MFPRPLCSLPADTSNDSFQIHNCVATAGEETEQVVAAVTFQRFSVRISTETLGILADIFRGFLQSTASFQIIPKQASINYPTIRLYSLCFRCRKFRKGTHNKTKYRRNHTCCHLVVNVHNDSLRLRTASRITWI